MGKPTENVGSTKPVAPMYPTMDITSDMVGAASLEYGTKRDESMDERLCDED